MKKWVITILAALVSLALALSVHSWVPWLLSFATQNKDDIEHLNTLAELISKLVTWPAAAILFIFGLWQRKKDADSKRPSQLNIQTGGVNAEGNASVSGDVVTGNKNVSAQGDAFSGDKKTVHDGDLVEGNKYVITQPQPVLPSPHQLPPPPADFTGRTAELRELRAAIEKGGIHISGLQGQGGVGKTALALKLAEELSPNYLDAQIYLDLKGVSEKPLTAAEAMSHVLRSFHPEAKLPEKEEDLRAQYLTVLHNKRALLLMDNAKNAAQVKPLIPPEGCALLVTSRQHFALPGLQAKNLETLPPPDAKTFLLRIAPRIDGEADTIAKLCGYLPQALRLAASAISVRVNLEPQDYARQLADEKKRLGLLAGDDESVTASITLSYDLLDAEGQRRWRMLAVFPDTFDVPAVGVVWEMEIDAARGALSRLLQFSMLEWNDSSKRYRMHDLMRDYAREQMEPIESEEAPRRHARFYGTLLDRANSLYRKGSSSIVDGLGLFDLEWANIWAGQAWAATHLMDDQEAAKLCSGYPTWGVYILSLRLHPRERIRWIEAALAAARRLKDRTAQGRHLSNLGISYKNVSEFRRAIVCYEERLLLARESHDRRGEGAALGNLGVAYANLGQMAVAINCYEKALAIARETGDRHAESGTLGNLGIAYNATGDPLRAADYHEQHLSIARQLGDWRGEGTAQGNLGLSYDSKGDTSRAIEQYEHHLANARKLHDRRGERNALNNLGSGYFVLGNNILSIKYHEESLAIARADDDQQAQGLALLNMSLPLDKLGDRVKAIEYTEAALEILEKIEDPNAARARMNLDILRNG